MGPPVYCYLYMYICFISSSYYFTWKFNSEMSIDHSLLRYFPLLIIHILYFRLFSLYLFTGKCNRIHTPSTRRKRSFRHQHMGSILQSCQLGDPLQHVATHLTQRWPHMESSVAALPRPQCLLRSRYVHTHRFGR